MSLELELRVPSWDAAAIEEAVRGVMTARERISGPVKVRVVAWEPWEGTRSRRYPTGEPEPHTLFGRVRRALVDGGAIEKGRIVDCSCVKVYGQNATRLGMTIDVSRP